MSGRSARGRLLALLAGPASLRARLSLVAVLVTAVFLGLLTLGVQLLLARQLLAGADDLVRSRAEAASTVVAVGPDGQVALREPVDAGALGELTWVYEGTHAVERPARPTRCSAWRTSSPAPASTSRRSAARTTCACTRCRCAPGDDRSARSWRAWT